MSDFEQMEMDMTLKADLDIKENILTAIHFTKNKIVGGDTPPAKVCNRHEAYGIAAENFSALKGRVKVINGNMAILLNTLPDPNFPALEAVSALCNSTTDAAVQAVRMAAEMQRTLNDLYIVEQMGNNDPTPMDELAASADDDFAEAEPAEAENE